MEPPVFYAPPGSLQGDSVLLSSEETHHARSVLRLRDNAQVIVVDGKGTAYKGTIESSRGKRELVVVIHNTVRNFGEPMVKLTLAAGLSEGSKFDAIVQKGTEIGVSHFVPLATEKSKVKIENEQKAKARVRRLERVALSAVKQCRRSYCPEIVPITKFSEFIKTVDKGALKLLFHPDSKSTAFKFRETAGEYKKAVILIGPESGFSRPEIEAAAAAGFQIASLGHRVLRTENAAPVACALVMNWLGELS
jgi:16S rRNA (uracil1498-N3)-methyltransferase